MKILFVDDEILRFQLFKSRLNGSDEIRYVPTLDDLCQRFENIINNNEHYDMISMDYDMFDPTRNCWLNTEWVSQQFIEAAPVAALPKFVIIHSVNPQGSWALYHIFMKKVKSFMSPFGINEEDYQAVMELLTK